MLRSFFFQEKKIIQRNLNSRMTYGASYMRKSLGFYPTEKSKSDVFEDVNKDVIVWLKSNKINGKNMKENLSLISGYAVELSSVLVSKNICLVPDSLALAYATIFAATGSYESYISKLKLNK